MLSFVGQVAIVNDKHLRMCGKYDTPFDCTVEFYPAVNAFSVFKGHKVPSRFARDANGSVVDGAPAVRKARLEALVAQVHANDILNLETTPPPPSSRADDQSAADQSALHALSITYRPPKEKKAGAFACMSLMVAFDPNDPHGGGGAGGPSANTGRQPISMVLPGEDPEADAPPATAAASNAVGNVVPAVQLAKMAASLRKAAFPFGPLFFTVIVSPVSGKGEGMKQWQTHAQPLIDISPHSSRTMLTTHRGHAEEYAETAPLKPNEVLVAVGGDGMAHEVVNGFRRRLARDRQAAEGSDARPAEGDNSNNNQKSLPRVALFPTGSGCALAKTLGIIEMRDAAMALVHANNLAIDLMDIAFEPVTKLVKAGKKKTDPRVEAPAEELTTQHRAAFLSVSFAFGAAVDIESEVYRWMGNARFTFYAVKKILPSVPSYPMRIRYKPLRASSIPASYHAGSGSSADAVLDTVANVKAHVEPFTVRRDIESAAAQSSSSSSAPFGASSAAPAAAATADDDGWVTIEQDEYVFVLFCNIPWIARDMCAAPYSHVNDGAIDLVYAAPGVDRKELVSAMIDMEEGKHVDGSNKIRYVKCSAVEVTPRDGLVSVDGERFPLAKVTATMSPERLPIVHQAIKPTPEQFEAAVVAAARVPPL